MNTNENRLNDIEQRIADLERENNSLKRAVGLDYKERDISRRQAIAAILTSGVLFSGGTYAITEGLEPNSDKLSGGEIDTNPRISNPGVRYATTPNNINTQFNKLPDYGGWVRLLPGIYTDSDFSRPIVIPSSKDTFYGLDLSGAQISISSFTGPYFVRSSTTGVPGQPIIIKGPSILDVTDVEEPGIGVQLWDTINSFIYMPRMVGNFDVAIDMRADQSSGHMNQISALVSGAEIGYRIGVETDSQTRDRSFFYGQINEIQDTGVEINKGRNNQFYVQPENGIGGATGYRVRSPGNIIHLAHGGPPIDTPLDVQAARTTIALPDLDVPVSGLLTNSRLGIRPSNVRMPQVQRTLWYYANDYRPLADMGGTGASHPIDDFNNLLLNAGEREGNNVYHQTPSSVGDYANGVLLYTRMKVTQTDAAVYRYGAWTDEQNYAQFINDTTVSPNWHVRIKVGGAVQTNFDTGIPKTESMREFICWLTNDIQRWFIDYKLVAETSVDISKIPQPKRGRIEAIVRDTPSSSIQITMSNWETLSVG